MSLLTGIYLRMSRNRFRKDFRPTKMRRNCSLLVHTGAQIQFMRSIPLISMLKKWGSITLIIHSSCSTLIDMLARIFFRVFYYNNPLKVLTREHSEIAKSLEGGKFDFLFDLSEPGNISIPYLANIDQRICVGGRNMLPYYNIVFDDSNALVNYFKLKPQSISKIFSLSKNKIKEIQKKYTLPKDYIVVNKSGGIKSEKKTIVIGRDINANNPELYAILLGSGGYAGENDHFAEFARINNIAIID